MSPDFWESSSVFPTFLELIINRVLGHEASLISLPKLFLYTSQPNGLERACQPQLLSS